MEIKNCIDIQEVYKSFRSPILSNISFSVAPEQIVTIMGNNGCGKTTLFNIVAGHLKPDSGSVYINGKKPNDVFPSIVYQAYRESLFPWWTARQNIEFASKCNPRNTTNALSYTNQLIEQLSINDIADRYPHQLSGGEAQITAIARALAFQSDILLFDEPSSSLGFEIEQRFYQALLEYCRRRSATMLLILHDPREAVYLSDKVIVLRKHTASIYKSLDINLEHPRLCDNATYLSELKRLMKICEEASQ